MSVGDGSVRQREIEGLFRNNIAFGIGFALIVHHRLSHSLIKHPFRIGFDDVYPNDFAMTDGGARGDPAGDAF